MKLNEIKEVIHGEYDLSEGVIPVHLTMTLEQVISAGKITNNVQYFTIAGLIGLFKDGGPTRWPRQLNSYPMATSSDVVEAVKGMTDKEAVEISSWLLTSLANPAAFEANPYVCTTPMNPMDWMRWVLKRQD